MNAAFTIHAAPTGKARPRVTSHGTYTPRKTVLYENRVMDAFLSSYPNHHPVEGPVTLQIMAVFPVPASWSRPKKLRALANIAKKITRPDIDNVMKSVMDGLNGVAWKDDGQIWKLTAVKLYGDTPRVEVVIETEDTNGSHT